MSKYEITPLNSNKTILQIVKGIEKYLHDNQIYKVFGYNGNYDAETELYDIDDLYTEEQLKADDVVLFNNCYLGIVDAVGTNNFSVKDVINFRGEKGDTGETGATGQDGKDGEDGEDGVGIASISSSQVDSEITLTFTLTDGTTQTTTFSISGSGATLVWSGSLLLSASLQAIGTLTFEDGKIYKFVLSTGGTIDMKFTTDTSSGYFIVTCGILMQSGANYEIHTIQVYKPNSQVSEPNKFQINKATPYASSDLNFFATITDIYKMN